MTYGDLPPVLNVKEAAGILGCSERHLRGLIATGELGHFRLGVSIRIARHQLLETLGAYGNADPERAGATTNTIHKSSIANGHDSS